MGGNEPAPALRWEMLDTPDGDFLELAHLDTSPGARSESDTTPRLFVMHGLEGSVDANYVRGL